MTDIAIFAAGMVVFFGVHLYAAFRPRGAGDVEVRLGRNVYRGLCSLASAVGLALLIWGYDGWVNAVPVWDPPFWTRHVPMLLMIPAMILFAAAELPRGRIKQTARHPMMLGVKLWALGHLIANGDLASILLFGGFLAFAVVDRIAVKRRNPPEPEAPASGMADLAAILLGLGLYALIVFWAHGALIGVPVM